MKLRYDRARRRFTAHPTSLDRGLAASAGFTYDSIYDEWVSTKLGNAVKLREYADSHALKIIKRAHLSFSPWLGALPYREKADRGVQAPLPFQPEAARFALSRNHSYLALDPGLGKSMIAALVRNALACPAVYITPPFLALNVKDEFLRWSTPIESNTLKIVPDSIIHRGETRRLIAEFVRRMKRRGHEQVALFVDEAHRFKNASALRTQSLLGDRGLTLLFDRVTMLSGTPLLNRPMELFPVLNRLAPETIGYKSEHQYGLRYCDATERVATCKACQGSGCRYCKGQGNHGRSWDYTGASHVSELSEKIKPAFMLRMRKLDVLKDLPPKTESLVFISKDVPPALAALDRKLLAEFSPEDLLRADSRNTHVSRYRKELGILKVPYAVSFLLEELENGDESFLVFAIHKEVVSRLALGLAKYRPLIIDGSVSKPERHARVAEFQAVHDRRVMILNIAAGGVGFTLTKATRVVDVEYSWSPTENDQCHDRSHRIGQEQPVHVQYLVFQNSMDRAVLESNLKKRKVINQI